MYSAGMYTFLFISKIHPNTEIRDRNLSRSKVVSRYMSLVGNRQVSGNHNKYTCKIKMHNFLLRGGTRHIISIYVFIQQVYTFFHTFSFDHCLYIEEIYEPFKPIGPFDQIKSKAFTLQIESAYNAQRKLYKETESSLLQNQKKSCSVFAA